MSLKPKGKRSILNRQLPQWCSGGSQEEKEHLTFCAQAFLRNPGSSVPHSWKTGLGTEEPALIFLSLFLTQKGSDSIAQDYWWGRNRTQTFPLWFENQAIGRGLGRAIWGAADISVPWVPQVSLHTYPWLCKNGPVSSLADPLVWEPQRTALAATRGPRDPVVPWAE